MRHPIQPIADDENGTLRFKKNAIVQKLLDDGPFDMNVIATWDVPQDDRIQFAQLIGYSLYGWGELSYVDAESWGTAETMLDSEKKHEEARLEALRSMVGAAKQDVISLAQTLGLTGEDL